MMSNQLPRKELQGVFGATTIETINHFFYADVSNCSAVSDEKAACTKKKSG